MSLIQEALRRKLEEEGRDPGTPQPVNRPSTPDGHDTPKVRPSESDRKYIVPTLLFTVLLIVVSLGVLGIFFYTHGLDPNTPPERMREQEASERGTAAAGTEPAGPAAAASSAAGPAPQLQDVPVKAPPPAPAARAQAPAPEALAPVPVPAPTAADKAPTAEAVTVNNIPAIKLTGVLLDRSGEGGSAILDNEIYELGENILPGIRLIEVKSRQAGFLINGVTQHVRVGRTLVDNP